jgi:hypothetical protein
VTTPWSDPEHDVVGDITDFVAEEVRNAPPFDPLAFERFIWRMVIDQDSRMTATFEADRLLLGGRVAMFSQFEDDLGAQGVYDFLTDPEEWQ